MDVASLRNKEILDFIEQFRDLAVLALADVTTAKELLEQRNVWTSVEAEQFSALEKKASEISEANKKAKNEKSQVKGVTS